MVTTEGAQGCSPQPADSPRSQLAPSKYWCPLCEDAVGFARKADCKRHVFRDHCTNSRWECTDGACTELFDSKKNYLVHAKETHNIVKPQPDTHRRDLPPQMVFACGFEKCKDKVFETTDDYAATKLADRYADHVSKHFDEGATRFDWRYSVMIKNLLHQPALKERWKEILPKKQRIQLSWNPRSAGHLRQQLEWRSWDNIVATLQDAIRLGSQAMSFSVQPVISMPNDTPFLSKSGAGAFPASPAFRDETMVPTPRGPPLPSRFASDNGENTETSHFPPLQGPERTTNQNREAWNTSDFAPWVPAFNQAVQQAAAYNNSTNLFFATTNQAPAAPPPYNTEAAVGQGFGARVAELQNLDGPAPWQAARTLQSTLAGRHPLLHAGRQQSHLRTTVARPASVVMEDAPAPEADLSPAHHPVDAARTVGVHFPAGSGGWMGANPSTMPFADEDPDTNFI